VNTSILRSFRTSGTPGFTIAALIAATIAVSPIVALMVIASEGSGDLWPQLAAYVLPSAAANTAILLAGVGLLTGIVGVGTAWLVATADFPARRFFDWALLLPLAIPTYILAYAYLDILHPLGPIHSALRTLFGIADPRVLRLPEVRSMGGVIFLLGFVLYPYVYLATRASFLMQSANALEAARMLGAKQGEVFFRIALPLARPAIVVGVTLALLEALNDIGATEFLGVRTLTIAIYSTWLNRSSLPGAAQISLFMLALVVLLFLLERWARKGQKFVSRDRRAQPPSRTRLTGLRALAAFLACALPLAIGFAAPFAYLADQAIRRTLSSGVSSMLLRETANTLFFAGLATLVTVSIGLVIAYALRTDRSGLVAPASRIASIGYAIPGTVLAVGLLWPLAAFDNAVDAAARQWLGIPTGLLISGSGAALVLAYTIRFLAMSINGLEAGYTKISTSVDHASRSLGESGFGTLRKVHLPMLRPALGAAAILVFVDCMKELPATLMLRPFGVETLATHIYAEAVRGTYEDGAVAAILIVLAGLFPVLMLARVSRNAIAPA
jgi:iron(III) transport system permease protein